MTMPVNESVSAPLESRPVMESDQPDTRILFGSYADVLFVLLPFAVVALFKVWNSGLDEFLLSYDMSTAAAILGGLAVVKFIVGMMADPRMLRHRERIVFLVAGTVFLILVPGLLFSVLIMLSDPVPKAVMFLQPLLLILSITAYSGAVAATHNIQMRLTGEHRGDASS